MFSFCVFSLFWMQPVVEQAEDGSPKGEEGEAVEEIDPVVYQYVPPEPKEWVSLGSEKEIEESSWKETEQKVVLLLLFRFLLIKDL